MSRAVLTVVLLAGAAAAGVWGLSSMLAPWPAAPARVPAARPSATVPAVRLPQLSAATPADAVPLAGARNPFRASEAGRHGDAGGVPARAATSAAVVAPVPTAPSWPRLDLIGVAEVREGAGLVRTAVIAGPRGVQHARPGDVIEHVWRLERVTPSGADVRLVPEDRVVHLALRP